MSFRLHLKALYFIKESQRSSVPLQSIFSLLLKKQQGKAVQ